MATINIAYVQKPQQSLGPHRVKRVVRRPLKTAYMCIALCVTVILRRREDNMYNSTRDLVFT